MKTIDLNVITNICANYSGPDYYVADKIPKKKLRNAQAALSIPVHEHVVMLVDATVFGSCKNGLAVTNNGVYWKNDWLTATDHTYLSWGDFVRVDISWQRNVTSSTSYIELGFGNNFNMDGSLFKKELLVQILQQLQKYISDTLLESMDSAIEVPLEAAAPIGAPTVSSSVPDTDDKWMIVISGQQYGPFKVSALKIMIDTNYFQPSNTLVWKQGMTNWEPFLQHPELTNLISPLVKLNDSPIPPAPSSILAENPVAATLGIEEKLTYATGPLDINTASIDQLLELPFIGLVEAQHLIQERKLNSGFQTMEEVSRLIDLKPHQVQKLSKMVTFSPLRKSTPTSRRVDL
ncbi:hypothetical protein J2T12_004385 [Paenibacillus anaericanus]|uniref:GYF domain-containing protein n=1 Tax=Paenibacillus anaericanus TaxID=170367 RepID=UPI0027843C64|nr:GYF domain-containing protein [Paenibacillus anaericanus]MDQ0090959.1 hypothetical protein [Paenibacillus anaericanus]